MSNEITTAFITQYADNVELLLQPGAMAGGSLLEFAVTPKAFTGKQASPVDQIGAVKAKKKTTRHGDTPIIETPHSRRWCAPTDYEWGDMIDKTDNLRTKLDFNGPYVQNGALSLNRAKDTEILKAFFNTALTGETGTTNTAFDSNNQIAAGGVGLTIEKLVEAKTLLMSNHVDVRVDPLFMAITSKQHENLLNELEVISMDFNSKPVLVDGMVMSYMGFNFIHIEMGDALFDDDDFDSVDGASARRVPCWAKSGMVLGKWRDTTSQIYPRPDKSNNIQVLVEGTYGATRTQEGKVLEVLCVE